MPDYSFVENSKIIEETKDQFKEYNDLLNKFPEKGARELYDLMDSQLKEIKSEIKLSDVDKFKVRDMKLKKDSLLAKVP
jgi:hypothetical protein